jgi:hypothetical protein
MINKSIKSKKGSRDSAVGIATGYGLDDQGVGVRVPVGSRIFSSPRRPDPALGFTQPPIQWVRRALSSGVKRPGRESDHSPPTSAQLVKHRDNFICIKSKIRTTTEVLFRLCLFC